MKMEKIFSVLLVLSLALMLSVFAAAEGGITITAPTNPSDTPLVGGPLGNANTQVNIYTSSSQVPSASGAPDGGIVIRTPSPEQLAGSSAPVITKDPYSETKEVGESTSFIVHADNYTSIFWYAIDPSTYERHYAYSIGDFVEGVTCTGTESEQLFINGITEGLNGWLFQADFSNAFGTTSTAMARITVNAPEATPTPTPMPTPTPTPAPTPTPTPAPTPTAVMPSSGGNGTTGSATGTVTSGGSSSTNGSGVMSNNGGAVMPTSGMQSATSTGIETGNNAEKGTTYTSLTGSNGSGINNTVAGVSARSYMGAYILAAAALLVILGAIAVMALYMKGKISLGKFEQVPDNNGDGDEFYNPDDFKKT